MSEPLRIAVAGLGTVGAETVRLIREHGALIAARCGRPIEIAAVSARDRNKARPIELSGLAW
ncbi:MAG: homoserine dehydrogenase, partial [Alphaproteobacteria bacterium]|nr:homoserine dehydrogenase [Alphaproteobacteria bacterium]